MKSLPVNITAHLSSWRIVASGALSLVIALGLGRFVFTPMLPMMQGQGLLTVAQGGELASIHFLGYLLGSLVAARLFNHRKGSILQHRQMLLWVLAASILGMGVTRDYTFWLCLRFLAGVLSAWVMIAVGQYHVRLINQLGKSAQQGWLFAGVGLGITLTGLLSLPLMVFELRSSTGWLMFGAVALLSVFLLRRFDIASFDFAFFDIESHGESPGTERRDQIISWWSLDAWKLVFCYGISGFGYIIPATYLPLMAKEKVENPLVFGWCWPILGLSSLIATVFIARVQAGLGLSHRQLWALAHLVMGIGLLWAGLSGSIGGFIIAGICVGSTFMVVIMAAFGEAHRLFPQNALSLIAVLTMSFALGQLAGPFIAGYLFSWTKSFDIAMQLAGGLLLFSAVMLLVVGGSAKNIPVKNPVETL